MLKFFLNFEPDIPTKTHQQGLRAGITRANKPYLYKDAGYVRVEQEFKEKLYSFRPEKPLKGPLMLETVWIFNHGNEELSPRTLKPDTDNLVKLLKDQMTACKFWKDDAQVFQEKISKYDTYQHSKHGVYVCVKTINELASTAVTTDNHSNKSDADGSVDAPLND